MVFLPLKKFLCACGRKVDRSGKCGRKKSCKCALKYKVVCGMDEVGRGPWAGPINACALILKKDIRFKGLKDSKKMTAAAREKIFRLLREKAVYGLGMASVGEIDTLGLTAATNRAFNRALKDMAVKAGGAKPDFIVVDGRDKLKLLVPHKTVIKGDEKIKLIACASIVAKVARDGMMRDFAVRWPEYGFDQHKGYGTRRHLQALLKYGSCPIHRKSFKPVKKILEAQGQKPA